MHSLITTTIIIIIKNKNQIEEHSKRVDHYSEPTDYVEAFLQEKKKKEAEGEGEFYRLEI